MPTLLDLIEQLVDGCLQLCQQRQEQQRPSFKDFVEPVYRVFEQVHEKYLANFLEYHAKLDEAGVFAGKVKELCGRLSDDTRFSADQETKVIPFMEISRKQLTSYLRDDPLIGFLTDIRSYLIRAFTEVCGTQYTGGTLRVMSPVFRNSMAARVRKIVAESALTEQGKHVAVAQVLDGIEAELQGGFEAVRKRYLAIQTNMAL